MRGHIRPDDLVDGGRRRAVLETGTDTSELWFESSAPWPNDLADPFLLGSILHWMSYGIDVHVHGTVSRRLLAGLTEWQHAWALWRPDRYRVVDITVDEVSDETPATDAAIVAFSGGVDAGFTTRRHLTGAAGWQSARLEAALLVHGFDIPLHSPEVFERTRARAERMLAGTGLELVHVRTNLRDLGQDWEDVFAVAVAACMALLGGRYGVGLIGSSQPYNALVMPWGSNPMTDHLASTGLIDIRHDGAGTGRTGKVRFVAEWPEARQHIRVCWQGEALDRNCGRCEKCVRTILNFRAAGAGLPGCFDADVADDVLRSMVLGSRPLISAWRQVVTYAEDAGTAGPWTDAARTAIRRSRARLRQTAVGGTP